jgi:hypothetical protein
MSNKKHWFDFYSKYNNKNMPTRNRETEVWYARIKIADKLAYKIRRHYLDLIQ